MPRPTVGRILHVLMADRKWSAAIVTEASPACFYVTIFRPDHAPLPFGPLLYEREGEHWRWPPREEVPRG